MNKVMKHKQQNLQKRKRRNRSSTKMLTSHLTSLTVDALACLGMTELEVVKFIVTKPGSQQTVASFNTTVTLTDDYFTLPPFRRYLSEEHLQSAVSKLSELINYLRAGEENARTREGKRGMVQGPDRFLASKTVESMELVLYGLQTLKEDLHELNPSHIREVDFKALLTLVCERLFSVMRSRYDMPLCQQSVQHLGKAVTETLKRMTDCGYHIYTSRTSYYSCPEGSLTFRKIPKFPNVRARRPAEMKWNCCAGSRQNLGRA